MVFQANEVHHKVWIPEPRWSWYGTPLWRTLASVLQLKTFEPDPGRFHGTVSITSKDLREAHISVQRLYFTEEEFVMFKLEGYEVNGEYDLQSLRRGTIYS